MQTFALYGLRLLGRPDFFRTFAFGFQYLLKCSDHHRTFAFGVERPDSSIWESGRTVGKTDFLSCNVSRIFPLTGNCLLRDILYIYHVLISPFHI